MTTKYRVEYALKAGAEDVYGHASDVWSDCQQIEWIKGLLAVPFVLHSQPTAVFEPGHPSVEQMAANAHRRYAEIMRDVEELVNDHSTRAVAHQKSGAPDRSKLKHLVPSIAVFFTPLCLHDAFVFQDSRRFISHRRFVAPSFNDIRLILNTSQVMSLVRGGPIELVTFDGDVTLYDDGQSLQPDNAVIKRILRLMARGAKIGIVTAAGYTQAQRYYERLHGLLDAVQSSAELTASQKQSLIVMGGEANYLFRFNEAERHLLEYVPRQTWQLEAMAAWQGEDIVALLDLAQVALTDCVKNMRLDADVIRKERGVGIVPKPGRKFPREQLEETVLATQKILEMSDLSRRVPFCAFNGGHDVFVDIGDKSWGVLAVQRFFGGIEASKTLHVGDQFLSAGANDFKARLACTTAWIASPDETVALLDEIEELVEVRVRKVV